MEELAIEVAQPGRIEPGTLAIPVSEDHLIPLSNGAKAVDERLKGRLQRLADGGELKGELGKTVLLHIDGELEANRVVLAGVGKVADVDADAVRTAASAVAQRVAD